MKYEIASKVKPQEETITLDIQECLGRTIAWTGRRGDGTDYIIAELDPSTDKVKFNIAGCMSLGLKTSEKVSY